MSAAVTRPYRGLAPFDDDPSDALLFFGREREREIIVANLLAARLTVLYGPSGVGKTSLLRAGVAQELRLLDDATVAAFASWSEDPTEAIDAVVARSAAHTYLILDQLEEWFLYRRPDSPLDRRLPELVTDPSLRVHVLLGVREDAIARLDVFKGRIPNLFANSLRLDHLDRDAARAAVLGPLRRLSELDPEGEPYRAEPELVEAVLDEVATGRIEYGLQGRGGVDGPERGRRRVEAPFLQLVLERLWDVERESGSRTLRRETLERLGGAGTIVRGHLERALERLDAGERELAAEMFGHLVTPSGTKIAHEPRDLARYAGVPEREVEDVLGRLARDRIVRAVESGSEAGRYEIFHDVLAGGVLSWRRGYEADRALARERARRRRAVAIAAAALLALAAVAAIALFALLQRERAQERETTALGRERAARALSLLEVDPERSLRLALQAAAVERTPQVESLLRTALLASRQRRVLAADPAATVVAFDERGRVLVPYGGVLRAYPQRRGARAIALFTLGGALLDLDDDLSLAAVADGRRLVLRRVPDGAVLREVEFRGPVRTARFDGTGSRVAVVAADAAGREYAYVVSVASGARTHVFRHRGTKSVAFSPDGRLLATGSADDSAKVWRLRDGREVATFDEHTGDVLAVEFDPAGSLLATASADSGVRVWRLEDGERRFLFVGHNNPTVALAWSPDGRFIADASLDRTGRILDIGGIGAGRMAAVVIGHEAGLAGVAYSRDGRRLVTVGQDGTARVWDGRAEHELRLLARHRPGETRATFGRDGRSVLSWGADGAFVTQIGGATRRIAAGPIADAELDAAGSTIATAGPTHAFLHGRSTATLRHRRPPVDVEFTADGRVVTASPDGWARIFARDGRLLAHLDHGEPVTRLATATGSIATAAAGGTVRIWRGGDVLVLPGHEGAVNALRFSPDATLLVSAGDDGVVRAWDALDGSLAYALPGHLGGATDAAFSPSGAGLVTTDRARHVRLWAAADGAPRRDLIGHFAPVNSVAFSGDGRWLVTTSALAAALWQATEGAPFAYLRGHTAPVVRSAAFAPDGRRIVTAGDDGTVRVYRCEVCGGTDDLVALARRRLANARVTR